MARMSDVERRDGGPKNCLNEKPTSQSVKLAGRFINLADLAAEGDFDHGYLSYIFQGKRTPSLGYLKRIAAKLRMTPAALLEAIEDRHTELETRRQRALG